MKIRKCDCLIVGAGPAGLGAAAITAAAGLDTVIIDKKSRPGHPVRCAEMVPRRFIDLLPFRLENLFSVDTMVTAIEGEALALTRSPGYMIDRIELSDLGISWAKDMGAQIITEARLVSIHGQKALVHTSGGDMVIDWQTMIAADGPGSTAARLLGLTPLPYLLGAQTTAKIDNSITSSFVFFDPEFVGGYGWIFPKRDRASIGVGMATRSVGELRKAISKTITHFKTMTGFDVALGPGKYVVGIIPHWRRPASGTGNCIFAGDAAGLAHPITGAGIQTAVISGQEAARACVRFCQTETDSKQGLQKDYSQELDSWLAGSHNLAQSHRQALLSGWTDEPGAFRSLIKKNWIAFPGYRG